MDLTEEQWKVIAPLLPPEQVCHEGRGRPWRDPRDVLHGILWVMRTGAPWKDLPGRYPPYQTCHRRFQGWVRDGTLERVLRVLAQDLYERGQIDPSEAFIDGSFAPAKKGASKSARPSGARGPRSWRLQTALVFLSPFASKVLRRTK